MSWEPNERWRIYGTFLTLSSLDGLWDRVEDAAWMQRTLEYARQKAREAAWRRTPHGRRMRARYDRERRARNKQRDAVVRCCRVCRRMYVVTRQQFIDKNGRFCSQRCAALDRYRRHQPIPTRYVIIDGKRRPLREWTKHYGITTETFYQRLRNGMSEVEALTTPKTTSQPPMRVRAVTIDGETRSVTEWARHFEINPSSVYVRMQRQGIEIAMALSAPKKPRLRPITIDGVTRSLEQWIKHFGIARATVQKRLRNGMSVLDALTRPNRRGEGGGRKPNPVMYEHVTIGGETRAVREWMEHLGVTRRLFYDRRKKGMPLVEALTMPKGGA